MTLQQLPTESLADHPVVLIKDVPRTVTKVCEPTQSYAIDLSNRRFKGLAALSWCQTSNRVHHLLMALRTGKAELPAKRVTKKGETLRSTVDNVCLLRV